MGLLDALNSDEGRFGLGLLSMAGPQAQPMSAGQRIAGAMQFMEAGKDRQAKEAAARMQQQYVLSQIAENESQNQARMQQMAQAKGLNDLIQSRLNRGGGGMSAQGGGQMPGAQGGMPSQGGQGMQGGGMQGGQQQSGGFPFTMDDILAIQAAKGPDFLPAYKFAKEGIKLEPGTTYRDPVTGEERMIPKLENGMIRRNGTVGYEPGYAESVASLEGSKTAATERAKYGYDIGRARETANIGADNDLVVVQLPSGPRQMTRAQARDMANQAAQQQQGAGSLPPVAGNQRLTPQLQQLIAQDAAANGIANPVTNFQGAGPNQAYGMTNAAPQMQAGPGIPLQSPAQAAADQKLALGRADQVLTREGKARNAAENLTNADRAIELLGQGPTGSGIGAALDKGAAIFGKATEGSLVSRQLDIVSANMVKNVPRFEGPQSNVDVDGYKDAAGRVADRTLPVAQRIAAAKEVRRYEMKALAQNGGDPARAGIAPLQDQQESAAAPKSPTIVDQLPTANRTNKGQRYRDKETGAYFISNGMQWQKE
jgi:hypothetical protein